MDETNSERMLKDLPVQTEEIAFKPEELISCAQCGRTNPPTRLNCFYCTAALAVSDAQSRFVKPSLRKLELWEQGFNLIIAPNARRPGETKLAEIAKLLKLEPEAMSRILSAETFLPAARVESEREAAILQTKLNELAIETVVVSDAELAAEKFPRRLRGMYFLAGKLILILFNQDEIVEIADQDLVLIIDGTLFERKLEASEKYVKKGEKKMLDTFEIASDEKLIDIYTKNDSIGFRILAKGFDFSCLGAEKGLLAVENIAKLAEKLREISPRAKVVSDYLKNRENLSNVWEVEQKTESHGLERKNFGTINFNSVIKINNLAQLTKYSRLQWNLL